MAKQAVLPRVITQAFTAKRSRGCWELWCKSCIRGWKFRDLKRPMKHGDYIHLTNHALSHQTDEGKSTAA